MREVAAYRRLRQRCSRAKAASRCPPCSANFFARRQRSPAESHWAAKGLRFKLAQALLRCLGRSLGLSAEQVKVYAVLGVAGGLVSVAFTKLLLGLRARFLRLPQKTVWFQPVAGGLLVGLMGWFVPQVLGVGYKFVGDALNGNMAFKMMLLLVILKLIAVTTSYASGNAGVIFGPALFHWRHAGRYGWDRRTSFVADPIPRHPVPTHWSAWAPPSRGSCGLR